MRRSSSSMTEGSARSGAAPPPGGSSLLLLKPDAVRRALQPLVAGHVARAGLRIVCRHAGVLSAGDLERLLPRMSPTEHVLEYAVAQAYYDAPVEVWIVEGTVDAVATALRVRDQVRASHAQSPIVNALHAPDHPAELAKQIGLLGGECARCRALVANVVCPCEELQRASSTPLLPQAWRDATVVGPLVRRLWNDPLSGFWQSTSPEPLRLGPVQDTTVWIHEAGHLLALDNYTAAILQALPGTSLGWALGVVLSLFHRGQLALVRTSREEAFRIAATLAESNVRASVLEERR